MYFLIPNYIVRSQKNDLTLINKMMLEKVITKNDVDKVLLIFKYFYANTTNSKYINFSIEDLTIDCGLTTRTENYKKFRNILVYLHEKEYIKQTGMNFQKVNSKHMIQIQPTYFKVNSEGKIIDYFILDDDEVEQIYSIDNVDNGKLLLYYSTLKSRIYTPNHESDLSAQVCYARIDDMAKDIGLSKHTIHAYNDLLVDNELIYIDNAGKFTKVENNKRIYKQSANTYTLTNIRGYEEEVQQSIKWYTKCMKEAGWIRC